MSVNNYTEYPDNPDRPISEEEFERMQENLEEGEFEALLLADLDRLTPEQVEELRSEYEFTV